MPQQTLSKIGVAMAWVTVSALFFGAGVQWQWEHAHGAAVAPRGGGGGGVHCLATCPAEPIEDPRVVCMHGNAERCATITITHGPGVPTASWLDEIVRKAAHPCTEWEDSGRGLVGMKTCVRPRERRQAAGVPNSGMVVLVLSSRDAFDTRRAIRETWASGHRNVYFVTGTCCPIPPNRRTPWVCTKASEASAAEQFKWDKECNTTDRKLSLEHVTHGDILSVDEVDVYRHLPQKLRAAYAWVIKNTRAKWILKTDTDTVVRIDTMEHYLETTYNSVTPTLIAGSINRNTRVVVHGGKWGAVQSTLALYKTLPPWPGGACHVVSRPVAQYVFDNKPKLHIAQGEDTSLGIWIDRSPLKMDFHASKHFITHSGNCKDKNAWAISHEITISMMRACYAHMDEAKHMTVALTSTAVARTPWPELIDFFIPWSGIHHMAGKEATDPARDRNNGELVFLLRSIALNAPWVHRIWIAVNGPVMPEVKVPVSLRNRTKLIDRCTFMPRGTCPTRNGAAVGAFAHLFEKLSEQWIYVDDDIFLGRPVKPSDFYTTGKPRVWSKSSTWGFFARTPFHRIYEVPSVVSFPTPTSAAPSLHFWSPQLKSVCSRTHLKYPQFYAFVGSHTMGRYSSRTRGISDNVNSQEECFKGWMMAEYLQTKTGVYFPIYNKRRTWWDEAPISVAGFAKIVNDRPIFMNVNDRFSKDPSLYHKQIKWFKEAMEALFPEEQRIKIGRRPLSVGCAAEQAFHKEHWFDKYRRAVLAVAPCCPDSCARWWHPTPQTKYWMLPLRTWSRPQQIRDHPPPLCTQFGQNAAPKHKCSKHHARLFQVLDNLRVVYFARSGTELGIVRGSSLLSADGDVDVFVDMPHSMLLSHLKPLLVPMPHGSGEGIAAEVHWAVPGCPEIHLVYNDWISDELQHRATPDDLCLCSLNSVQLMCHKDGPRRMFTQYGPSWFIPMGLKQMDMPLWLRKHTTSAWTLQVKRMLHGLIDVNTGRVTSKHLFALLPNQTAPYKFGKLVDVELAAAQVNVLAKAIGVLHRQTRVLAQSDG
jgi:hypothetical protein